MLHNGKNMFTLLQNLQFLQRQFGCDEVVPNWKRKRRPNNKSRYRCRSYPTAQQWS